MIRLADILRRLALLTLALGCPVFAQQVLMVNQGGRYAPVVAMQAATPVIVVDGKLELAARSGSEFAYATAPGKTFAPAFVTVRNLAITSQDHITDPSGRPQDRALAFHADFESAYVLDSVFLTIEVKGSTTPVNSLYAYEVGRLRPGATTPVHFVVRFEADWADCKATLHLFAGGIEVLHSEMPPTRVAQELDQMVQAKLTNVTNAPPQQFMCPPPIYPAAALGSNAAGSATIVFEISATGAVTDPVLKQASQPEFGEAALAAVREWRFLPRVKNGRPVATRVELPLSFKPPPPDAKH